MDEVAKSNSKQPRFQLSTLDISGGLGIPYACGGSVCDIHKGHLENRPTTDTTTTTSVK